MVQVLLVEQVLLLVQVELTVPQPCCCPGVHCNLVRCSSNLVPRRQRTITQRRLPHKRRRQRSIR
jgi:hypothetical protein